MRRIGGNLEVEIQVKTVSKNELHEQVETWETEETLKGFLDLNSGDSKYTSYEAKIQESSHVFICDYKELSSRINSENSRLFEPKTRKAYDIMLIDNPMNLNRHLEFYLKYTGGQNG